MAKRKREEDAHSPDETEDSRTRRELGAVIASGISRIASTLEHGRRFERQKLGKRQHLTKNNDVEGRKLNVEIANLKALNMKEIARQRLHKELVKTTSIARTGKLPEDVVLPKSVGLDRSEADLRARLFKHREVGEAMEKTMTEVRQVLGLQTNGGVKKQKMDLKPEQKPPVVNGHTEPSRSISVAEISDAEEEFQGFSSRIASPSGSERESNDEPSKPHPLSHLDISDSETDSNSDTQPAPKTRTRAPTKVTSSAFLPSLSMGGYLSNSESEASDIEDHIAPRKNRRGQRARQKIWEQKFKDSAKHVVNPPAPKEKKRDEGWDAQRGAVGKDDRRARYKLSFKGDRGSKGPSGGNMAPLGRERREEKKVKHKDDEGALHPSWQAKKMAKQQSAGIGAFQGKKMTFD
jgi:hypothetical protein